MSISRMVDTTLACVISIEATHLNEVKDSVKKKKKKKRSEKKKKERKERNLQVVLIVIIGKNTYSCIQI